jgi:lipase
VQLHVLEWGDPGAPPVVCIHGVTGHAGRFRQLAEERWAERFHVVAVDLRGHGRSGWEPPFDYPTHVADLVETIDALGLGQPDWVGHSFGGRLILELAARHPDRIRRAVLLDPAIHLISDIAELSASGELAESAYVWDSVEAYVAGRRDAGGFDLARAVADVAEQVETLPDGRVRRLTAQEAMASIYREIATEPPPAAALTMPTLLLYAPAFGLVRPEQVEAYGLHGVVEVPGMHMVMWAAFDETADAVERFLSEDAGAQG